MEQKLDLTNYPIWYTPFRQTLYFKLIIIFVAVLVVTLVSVILLWYFKKRRKKTYFDLIQKYLKDIEIQYKKEPKNLKKNYSDLVQVLRFYLENRFNFKISNLSDKEVVVIVDNSNLDSVYKENINQILQISYNLKFSRDVTNVNLNDNLESKYPSNFLDNFNFIQKFIKDTRSESK